MTHNAVPLNTGRTSPDYKTRDESNDGRASARRGAGYDEFCSTSYPELIAAGKMRITEAADGYGTSAANVSRWMAAYHEDRQAEQLRENWTRDDRAEANLIDFKSFCDRYWPDEPLQPFHVEWADEITANGEEAGKLLLMASQRHGKTSMLWKYAIWRICRDPDLRILWVGKTMGLAEEPIGRIRQEFEHNTKLVDEMFGPSTDMKPPTRSGLSWTNSKMTISQRTKVLSAPTLAALGIGGSILGRDADLIIIDDPIDRASASSPTEREAVSEWFLTDFMSRKMPNTSVNYIGSRQHVSDLPGQIIRDHADDWRILVYRAHDPACTIPEDDVEDHTDCVLWPELRPWSWLYQQKKANPAHFERNYQNAPTIDATTFITAKDIDELKDSAQEAGYFPPGSRLVAGIDPAAAKPVAAVLWAYTRDGKRFLVDAKLATAGTQGVKEVVAEFVDTYGCRTYVVETNGYQGQIMQDEGIKAMRSQLNLRMVPTYTSRINKWDEGAGVVAMLHGLRDGEKYVLPGSGDAEILQRLEDVYRQWLLFDPDYVGHKHAQDDLVMASWFPQGEMDQWEKAATAQVVTVKSNFGRVYGMVGVNL